MSHRVTYEFIFCNKASRNPRSDDWGLRGITVPALASAHRMLSRFMQKAAMDGDRIRYCETQGTVVLASRTAQGSVCAVLPLEGGSTAAAVVIAEVCAFLGCHLAPMDGGPAVAPTAEALLADLSRRAIALVRPPGRSLCGAGSPAYTKV